jgi:hypothetical protein
MWVGRYLRKRATVVDQGVIESEAQLNSVFASLKDQGYKQAVVADVEGVSHWWALQAKDGEKLVYFGTPESFEKKFGRKP